ncbi:coiled-coil domain-containing protein 112-like [Hylaeus anthracinus]|uniref:coiled-coil domain-containing protein 112-like n=1 Tax=Hylaeus anthracinus TaxID=313031 RepID=UPI0023B97966|nr:coiled-coil domain-containing protein 112-like [Hylaeus anthracinus]
MEINEDKVEEKKNGLRRKMSSAERDLWLKPLLKLKQQEIILDRGVACAIDNMKIDKDLLQEIIHERKEMSSKRQIFLNTMYKYMEDIATEMDSIKLVARNPEELKKLDVNTYKLKLIKFWQKMQDFKKSCCIEALVEEQATLRNELRDFEPRIKKYEHFQKNVLSACQSRIESRRERKDYRDAEDFHALVARTGHTENWSTDDHLYFLKMRKKCNNIPALVAAVQKKFPDLSTETIVNHEAWYKLYTDLREKQKSVVKEWRQKRELKKIKSAEESRNNQNYFEENDDSNEKEKTEVFKKKKLSRSEASRSNHSADSNVSLKKDLIKKWRMEKENKRTMDEEQLKIRIKLKRETEEKQRRRRREKILEALEEYKKKKSLESASRESSANSKDKCTYDSELVKAFRKQDKEYTKKRKELILRSQKSHKIEMTEAKRSVLLNNKNFSTLLNSTVVWREKCKFEDPVGRSNEPQYVKDIPKLCFRWRNEESEDLKDLITFI